ncbi:MAG: hypothetical protein M3014_13550 [Chloroflexota bacterium]|nr:hypothetical protein [Chloroflexota bacterium]
MIPESIRERLDEQEIEFLEQALELYNEQSNHNDQLLAGGIARSLRWRMTGAELNKFVRRLHSRGFVLGTKTVAGGPAFWLDPSLISTE